MSTPTDILIDARQQGWFWMEDAVIDTYGRSLGAIGVAIYAYLARRADANGVSFPSYGTIARDLNLGRRTVINHIAQLEKLGLIIVHRRRGQGRATNVYQLVNLRGREPDPAPPVAGAAPPAAGEAREPEPVIAIPLAAMASPTGAADARVSSDHPLTGVTDAPVQEMHQSSALPTGVSGALVQEMHRGGVTDAPPPVQEMHPTGAAVAPEGNTTKDTQKKETQMKEKKTRPPRAREAVSPDDPPLHSSQKKSSFGFLALEKHETPKPEPAAKPADDGPDALGEMLDALAQVTGKNVAFLRPVKREEFQTTAQKLLDYDFTPEDARQFGRYWQEAHPIGSNKRNAGRPHLSQVLEDLPASREWNRQRQQEEADDDDFPALIVYDGLETPAPQDAAVMAPLPAPQPTPVQKPQPENDEAQQVWGQLHTELRMSLPGHPLLRPLDRARPLGYRNGRLTLLMPDDAGADVWRLRMTMPVERAALRAFAEPVSVLFLGPTEATMFA